MSLSWLEPDWGAPAGVRALSTQRAGGVSAAPYESLNLGDHVGDVPAAVTENRRRLRQAAALPAEPLWLRQIHGTRVVDLDAGPPEGGADAAYTRRPGRICAILSADCLPVLLAAEGVVAAAHAGWRGLAAGVLEATVAALEVAPAALSAWIGPAIGVGHYEVGAEVRDALLDGHDAAATASAMNAFATNTRGRYMADLAMLARQRLARAGIRRIHGGTYCTYGSPHYFSHRRDGRTGRQATLIWLQS
jgi:YfiH family protein